VGKAVLDQEAVISVLRLEERDLGSPQVGQETLVAIYIGYCSGHNATE